jgi:hypothetical protein
MHRVLQTIRQVARHEIDQRCNVSLGVVKSTHGADGAAQNYACTVQLRESGIVLPKVPIATSLIGTAALPREKDLVVIVFVGGDLHSPVVMGRLYSEAVAPPNNKQGQFVAVLPGDEESSDKRLELTVDTPGDGTRSLRLVLDGAVKIELTIDDGAIRLKAQDTTLELTQSGSSPARPST